MTQHIEKIENKRAKLTFIMESNMKGDGVSKNDKNIGEKEFCDSSEHLSRHEHMTSHPATQNITIFFVVMIWKICE